MSSKVSYEKYLSGSETADLIHISQVTSNKC